MCCGFCERQRRSPLKCNTVRSEFSARKMKLRGLRLFLMVLLVTASFPKFTSAATFVVNHRNPNASDSNPGTESQPFKTIAPAAERAQPGDTVLVHGGIYRER